MGELRIRWQRLVDEDGGTCDRCGATGTALDEVFEKLRRALGEVGLDMVLEKQALSPSTFSADPLESNRIWLAGRPLEEWIGGTVGQSACCSSCGDSDCRTITVDGTTYEAVAPELILEAGLLAAAHLVRGERQSSCCAQSAEDSEAEAEEARSSCCEPDPVGCC